MARRARNDAGPSAVDDDDTSQVYTAAARCGTRIRPRGAALKPRHVLGASIVSAQALKRRKLGVASAQDVVRTSGTEMIDRSIARILDEAPVPTAVDAFVRAGARTRKIIPRRQLGPWVSRIGGQSGTGRNPRGR